MPPFFCFEVSSDSASVSFKFPRKPITGPLPLYFPYKIPTTVKDDVSKNLDEQRIRFTPIRQCAGGAVSDANRTTLPLIVGNRDFMTPLVLFMRVLEVLFFAGLAGSSIVVFISFFEDAKELFAKDEPPESKSTRAAA